MDERGKVTDRHGRVWTVTVLTEAEAEEADFRFWSSLTPEERVRAVADCTLSALKTRGIRELPRLRRVHRVLEPARPESFDTD